MNLVDKLKMKIVMLLTRKEATTMTEVLLKHTESNHYCPHCGKEVKLYPMLGEDNSKCLITKEYIR